MFSGVIFWVNHFTFCTSGPKMQSVNDSKVILIIKLYDIDYNTFVFFKIIDSNCKVCTSPGSNIARIKVSKNCNPTPNSLPCRVVIVIIIAVIRGVKHNVGISKLTGCYQPQHHHHPQSSSSWPAWLFIHLTVIIIAIIVVIIMAIIIVIIWAISGIRVFENCTQTPNSRLASAER